jgi:hypothetical protein
MGFIKQAKADNFASSAKRAAEEGHQVFVVQFRGAMMHSPALSRPVQDAAEMIESVEANGWQLDKMTGIEWHDNITLICLFRNADPRRVPASS